ncbi:MAG: hypothetical protein KAY32_09610 [Candidatus Eisenbacteria sp.]|nr:hypothetical protein [Candidatus Eisenbacteria bacterium]
MQHAFKLSAAFLGIVLGCIFVPASATAQWVLVDSTSFTALIAAGEDCYVRIPSFSDYFEVVAPPENLTADALTAVSIAPSWLQMDLRDNFRRLDQAKQDVYADLIINATAPYIDEICFEIAHIAPQTLSTSMNPQVLVENVVSLYAIDASLDYVDIVDYDTGADFYSTTVYRVLEGEDVLEFELPREIYYWYVVHPKLHQERPGYIDPNSGFAIDPPTGVFWRDYLMNHSDDGYPLLLACIDTCDVLWKNTQNSVDNGAVGAVTQWIKDVMTFTSNPHHDQPVRIYTMHIGTCSVHSYLTAAAGRAALIPTLVDVMYSDNHKINEFWERRWIAWEPVNTFVDYPEGYENWGWDVAAAFNWRGDSYIWDATPRYTEVCTLNVHVTDSEGHTVDGARIKVNSEPCVDWGATAGWTDCNGDQQILLGDNRTFEALVNSSLGNYPPSGMETIIVASEAGTSYEWNVTLPGAATAIDVRADSMPEYPTDDYRLVVEYDVAREIVYGKNYDDIDRFSEPSTPGHIDFFVCDQENFDAYTATDSLAAFEITESSAGGNVDWVLVSSDPWYAVFSNTEALVMTRELHCTAKLYARDMSAVGQETAQWLGPGVRLHQSYPDPFSASTRIRFEMAAGAHVRLAIHDVAGRQVRTLLDGFQRAGGHTAVWNGRDQRGTEVPCGIYFCRIEIGEHSDIWRMVRVQ